MKSLSKKLPDDRVDVFNERDAYSVSELDAMSQLSESYDKDLANIQRRILVERCCPGVMKSVSESQLYLDAVASTDTDRCVKDGYVYVNLTPERTKSSDFESLPQDSQYVSERCLYLRYKDEHNYEIMESDSFLMDRRKGLDFVEEVFDKHPDNFKMEVKNSALREKTDWMEVVSGCGDKPRFYARCQNGEISEVRNGNSEYVDNSFNAETIQRQCIAIKHRQHMDNLSSPTMKACGILKNDVVSSMTQDGRTVSIEGNAKGEMRLSIDGNDATNCHYPSALNNMRSRYYHVSDFDTYVETSKSGQIRAAISDYKSDVNSQINDVRRSLLKSKQSNDASVDHVADIMTTVNRMTTVSPSANESYYE